ncbi:phosphodiester glycosidase family protein [Paenibacillus glycinis]|uniref:Phosphodiester glycosidase domain-containing protein n=1 Tax=Paenibacillus glycinis TaxID=2697035 RepID=A0ABW9XPK4_9BACL|nr:phosphodiester glycosidase family protein [Paenibacillus glycinis]NBD24564.1 hypothetical protein [Paenibacillus glycinis]
MIYSRKIVHLLLSLAMIMALNSLAPFTGSASAEAVISIDSQADLEQIRSNPSGSFQLTADIDLTGSFVPLASFSGSLDGNGHLISDLTITGSASQPKAAFIVDNEGLIKSVGFIDVNIHSLDTNSTYWASGIVGTNNGTIEESFVTGTVSGGYRSAGIAITNRHIVRNVYSVASVDAKVESGALVAVSENGSTLESSYAVPDVHSDTNNTGGLTAYAYTGAVIRNNALLAGTIDSGSGSNIARIAGRLNGTPTFQNNIASTNALVQGAAVSGGTAANNQGLSVTDASLAMEATYESTLGWDFYSVWDMSAALGRPILRAEESTPTEISTAADLNLIRGNPSGDYKLTNDIVLTGRFTPIASFSGTLNGDGHAIIGLTVTADANHPKAALLAVNNGIVEKLGLVDAAIVGNSDDSDHWAAGIAAENRGMIRESFVTGVVTGGYRSAGIAAHNFGIVKNSYTDAIVKAKVESGALVAVSESGSTLESSYAKPHVYSEVNNTGGLSAYAYTGAVIRDNALLAGTIDNGTGDTISRITGRVNGTPTFQNNIASSNALVQGKTVTGGTVTNNKGLSVTDAALALQSAYETTLGWNFDQIWEMDAAAKRPVLRYFGTVPTPDRNPIIFRVLRDETETLSTGVDHRQMDFIDANGNRQKANIIEVAINLPQNHIIVGVKGNRIPPTDANGDYIRTVDAEGHDVIKGNVAVQAATTVIPGKKVVAGVNGEFYTEQGPEGYMIKDGSSIINGVRTSGADGKSYPFHGFFGIKDDGTAMIGNYGEDWEKNKNDLYEASGGQYWMVKDGVAQNFNGLVVSDPSDPNYDEQTYYRHADRHPRTAVGIRSDGNVFFAVVDGRGANGSTGFYIEELGLYMKELGAYQALNMDGGGSSTEVTLNEGTDEYEIRNTPINKVDGVNTPGVPRDVFSSLLVIVDQP